MSSFDRLLPELALCILGFYVGSVYFTRDMNISSPAEVIASKVANREGAEPEEVRDAPLLKIVEMRDNAKLVLCEQILSIDELKLQVELALQGCPERKVNIEPLGGSRLDGFTDKIVNILNDNGVKTVVNSRIAPPVKDKP